jgi:hypothetical protein
MKTIYTASHIVDAHMIVNLLEQYELKAFVQGEYLQAAAGDLPAGQLIRVEVDEVFYEQAKAILHDWELQNPVSTQATQENASSHKNGDILWWCAMSFGLGFVSAYVCFVLLG